MTELDDFDQPPGIGDIGQPGTAEVELGPGVARFIRPLYGPSSAQALLTASSLTPAQLALYAGWTMAVLYAVAHDSVPLAPKTAGLPTVHELSEPDRRTVELDRLRRLLECLAELPDCSRLTAHASALTAGEPDFKTRIEDLHLSNLGVLASAGLELELAYQLGRSLHDTVSPRAQAEQGKSPAQTLARARVATLQEWLGTLSAGFPREVAAIVSASLGRWSDFAELTIGAPATARPTKNNQDEFPYRMRAYLQRQGDIWLMLLVGARSTDGLVTPEGYVTAGEAALRRSTRIIGGVLKHYWGALLIVTMALGGILYLAASQMAGASQVWTSIVAIGSSLGISAQSIRSAIGRLGTEAERPVLTAAEEDVKAWAITTMPLADLTARNLRRLRKSGIAPPVGLGRF